MQKKTVEAVGKSFEARQAQGLKDEALIAAISSDTGLRPAEARAALKVWVNDKSVPVQSNWHKKARAFAYKEASKQGLWENLFGSLSWWRKLLARIFPRAKARYDRWVARAYKSTLKHWKREVYVQLVKEREERLRFARMQQKASRARGHKYFEERRKSDNAESDAPKPKSISLMHEASVDVNVLKARQ